MSVKIKDNASFVLSLLKSAILGVITSIVLVLILAFVLKFIEISDGLITIIDEIIKIISIFIASINLVKRSPYKILFKSALLGAIYTLLTYIVFSALKGSYIFGLGLIIDIVLGAVVGIIIAVILNIFTKEKTVV